MSKMCECGSNRIAPVAANGLATLNALAVTVIVGGADVTLCALMLAWTVLVPAAAPTKVAV